MFVYARVLKLHIYCAVLAKEVLQFSLFSKEHNIILLYCVYVALTRLSTSKTVVLSNVLND